MGIYNVRVEEQDLGADSAVIRWDTTQIGTTEIQFGQVVDGVWNNCMLTKLAQPDSMEHAYVVNGLEAGKQYRAKAWSFDNNNTFDWMPCDDGDGCVDFQPDDPAPGVVELGDFIITDVEKPILKLGESTKITVQYKNADGSPDKGIRLMFNQIRNLSVADGTFTITRGETDNNGVLETVFTPTRLRHPRIKRGPILLSTYTNNCRPHFGLFPFPTMKSIYDIIVLKLEV